MTIFRPLAASPFLRGVPGGSRSASRQAVPEAPLGVRVWLCQPAAILSVLLLAVVVVVPLV